MWCARSELLRKGGFPAAQVVPPTLETAFNHDIHAYGLLKETETRRPQNPRTTRDYVDYEFI